MTVGTVAFYLVFLVISWRFMRVHEVIARAAKEPARGLEHGDRPEHR